MVVTETSGWAAFDAPHTGVWIEPVYGWGFSESIDGQLSIPFEIFVKEIGVDIGDGVLGWRGKVLNSKHKYGGMDVTMSPRHVEWSGFVVLWVFDDGKDVFNGMANTKGLECNWK